MNELRKMIGELHQSNLTPNERELLVCIERLANIVEDKPKQNGKRVTIDSLLMQLGIRPDMSGFNLIKMAIRMLITGEAELQNIYLLYGKMARKLGGDYNSQSIYRNILYAINKALKSPHRTEGLLQKVCQKSDDDAVSNKEFMWGLYHYCMSNNISI